MDDPKHKDNPPSAYLQQLQRKYPNIPKGVLHALDVSKRLHQRILERKARERAAEGHGVTMCAWAPKGSNQALRVGAIWVPKGERLYHDLHLLYLADRVQKLVNQEPDPQVALTTAEWWLDDAGLLWNPLRLENAGEEIILNIESVRSRLSFLGVPGNRLPAKITSSDPAAEWVLENMDLASWLTALTWLPPDGDR